MVEFCILFECEVWIQLLIAVTSDRGQVRLTLSQTFTRTPASSQLHPDHQSIKGTRFHWLTNIRIFSQIKLLWEIMCFYWNKTFLGIMEVDGPNVPGEARDVVYDNLKWARLRPRLSNWGWPEINYQLRAVSGFCLWAEAGPGPGLGLEWCEGPEPEPGPRSQCPEDLGAGSRGETRKISDDWWKFRGSSNYHLVHVFFVLYWFKLGEMNKMCKHGNGRTQKPNNTLKCGPNHV